VVAPVVVVPVVPVDVTPTLKLGVTPYNRRLIDIFGRRFFDPVDSTLARYKFFSRSDPSYKREVGAAEKTGPRCRDGFGVVVWCRRREWKERHTRGSRCCDEDDVFDFANVLAARVFNLRTNDAATLNVARAGGGCAGFEQTKERRRKPSTPGLLLTEYSFS